MLSAFDNLSNVAKIVPNHSLLTHVQTSTGAVCTTFYKSLEAVFCYIGVVLISLSRKRSVLLKSLQNDVIPFAT